MPVYHRPMPNWWQQPPNTYTVPDARAFRRRGMPFSLPVELPQQGGDLSAWGEMPDPRQTAAGDDPTPTRIPPYVPFGVIDPGRWQ